MTEQPDPEAAVRPVESVPSSVRTTRRVGALRRTLQLLALALVLGLMTLLVWRVVASGRGSSLVNGISDGQAPAAPGLTLPVIWTAHSTWPRSSKAVLADGRVSRR
jgi:hypothetical protein